MINVSMRGASPFITRRRQFRAGTRFPFVRYTPPSLRRACGRFRPLGDQLAYRRGAF